MIGVNRQRGSKGFTMLELMTTTGIIAILVSQSVLLYDEYKQRTYAMAVVVDLRNIETAIRAYMLDMESGTWPFEDAIPSGGDDPSIQQLASNPAGLGKFMKVSPVPLIGTPRYYAYDNDSWDPDGYNSVSCSQKYDGVGLVIHGGLKAVHYKIIQKALDGDNNLNCGKVRQHNVSGIYYMLSPRYNVLN